MTELSELVTFSADLIAEHAQRGDVERVAYELAAHAHVMAFDHPQLHRHPGSATAAMEAHTYALPEQDAPDEVVQRWPVALGLIARELIDRLTATYHAPIGFGQWFAEPLPRGGLAAAVLGAWNVLHRERASLTPPPLVNSDRQWAASTLGDALIEVHGDVTAIGSFAVWYVLAYARVHAADTAAGGAR